jgi:hypothetical protein
MIFKHRKRTVRIYLAGGLGNQLFQLYAGIFFSLKYERELILDYRNIDVGITGREDRINFLDLDALPRLNIVWGNRIEKFFVNMRIKILRRFIRIFDLKEFFGISIVNEIGFKDIACLRANQTLFGYFQSWRYVDYVESRIDKIAIRVKQHSQWYLNLALEIEKIRPIIIHIRLGDYASLSETFGLLDRVYFENALKSASQKTLSRSVFIFSDEPKKAYEVFNNLQGFEFTYIDPPPESKDFESLLLMGSSDILVISNSTFSWWSAFLSKTPIVYCPDKWFKNMNDPIDLIPAKWNKIPSAWR